MSLLLTIGILFTFMISLCVKKAHSLSRDNPISKNQEQENHTTKEVFQDEESSTDHLNEFKSLIPYFSTVVKKDPGGLGFLDEVGGSVDGLTLCTESLGFESSDERRDVDDDDVLDITKAREESPKKITRRTAARSEVKKYPPPLSSFNCNGKPNFFLRAMRKDGRLELAEVEIEQPEIFKASREDGRLKLHLVQELDHVEDGGDDWDEEEEEIVETSIQEKEEEKWLFPATISGTERFPRCHEAVTHHHHHHHMHRVGSLVW